MCWDEEDSGQTHLLRIHLLYYQARCFSFQDDRMQYVLLREQEHSRMRHRERHNESSVYDQRQTAVGNNGNRKVWHLSVYPCGA